ncbi:hypothetical protein BBJ28_00023263 [Nothophytophthora sp. Chile5]|nr:hypothetical protein BBJ28_00023263 [Nothophytophthora sp. Chile5]
MSVKLESADGDASVAVERGVTHVHRHRRSRHRCGCVRREGCAVCGKCVERHCVCGVRDRRRMLCLESRACNCPIADPADRCILCRGCRKAQSFSHCRCIQHQRQLRNLQQQQQSATGKEDEQPRCSCFLLANAREGGHSADTAKIEAVRKRNQRLRRVKRAVGLPSSDNVFRKKIVPSLGDSAVFGLDGDDEADADVITPSIDSVLPRSMATKMLGPINPPPYHPLFRAEGASLLETVEPREGNREELVADRSVSFDLVDYLVYMASVKASNVGELVGTFEDSAAVAASIVLEEYMAQLVDDVITKQRALCPSTQASVVAFTQELLEGFNWRLYQQQSTGRTEVMIDDLVAMILREFLTVQTCASTLAAAEHTGELTAWIKSAIVILQSRLLKASDNSLQTDDEEASSPTPRVRLAVKTHPVVGTPTYKLSYETTLPDGHHVDVSADGIESKARAKAAIAGLSEAVKRQDKRSKIAPVDPYADLYAQLRQQVGQFKVARKESGASEEQSAARPSAAKKPRL